MKRFLSSIAPAATAIAWLAASPGFAETAGFTRLSIADPVGGQMQVSVWYPTDAPAAETRLGPFVFQAARDAVPTNDPKGLVVMSHGTTGSDLGHRNIGLALAQAGYIAAAPLHPRDNFRDASGVGTALVMAGRPLQVSAVIDAVLDDPRWRGRIPKGRIGAFGFSLGGYTTLALLGATPDLSLIAKRCKSKPDDPLCGEIDGISDRPLTSSNADMTAFGSLADPRICAAVIVDPLAVVFGDDELAGIKTPFIQIWRPEIENVLLADSNAARVVRQLNQRAGHKETGEIVVSGAHHYSFLDVFPEELIGLVPSVLTEDQAGFDRVVFQKTFAERTTDFLKNSLQQCSGR